MPRWASRLTLTVTDVRVQRVQEISEGDAMAEGILHENVIIGADGAGGTHREISADRYWNGTEEDEHEGDEYASEAFANLWDSLNAQRGFGWDANPWVIAVTFEAHRCNIDKMESGHG